MTDSQLLQRFIADRDDTSFRTLIARHGPTVLRACRRVLDDPHEVDDAFQATFLVLMRKAPTLHTPEALGNWLHGVATYVASRARRNAARRRKHEQQKAAERLHVGATDCTTDDLARVVREELDRLPEPYRAPLELCYLRGRSHEAAATELGWPLGTLKVRLVRGRERLRRCLDRRGVSLGIGLLFLLSTRRSQGAVTRTDPVADADTCTLRTGTPERSHRPAAISARAARSWPALALLAALTVTAAAGTYYAGPRAVETAPEPVLIPRPPVAYDERARGGDAATTAPSPSDAACE